MHSSKPAKRGATVALARFAADLNYRDIPREVVDKAKLCVLDTLGCCVYGSTLAPMAKLTAMVVSEGAKPVASIFGTPHRTSASQAALVNGSAAHAFQLDEVHTGSTLHPGSVAVPAAFALSERAGGVHGGHLITAVIARHEISQTGGGAP